MISAQRWSHPHNGGMMPQQPSLQQQFNYPQQQQQQMSQQMTGQPRFMPSAPQTQFGQSMIGPQMTGQPRYMPSAPQLSTAVPQQRMGNQPQTFSMGRSPTNGQGFQQQMSQQQPYRPPSSGQFLIPPQQPSMMQQPSFDNRIGTSNNFTNMQSPIQTPFNNNNKNPMLSRQFNTGSQTQPSFSFRPPSMTLQSLQQQPMQSQLIQQQMQQQQQPPMQSQLMQQQQLLQQQQMQQLIQQQRSQIPAALMPPAIGADMPVFTRPRTYSNTTDYTTTTGPNSSLVKKSFSRYRATKLASVSVTFFDATYPPEATIGVSLDEAKLAYTVNDSLNIRNIPVCAIAVNSQNDSLQAGDVIVTVNGIPTINVKNDLTGEFERPRMLTLKMLTDLQKSVRTIRFMRFKDPSVLVTNAVVHFSSAEVLTEIFDEERFLSLMSWIPSQASQSATSFASYVAITFPEDQDRLGLSVEPHRLTYVKEETGERNTFDCVVVTESVVTDHLRPGDILIKINGEPLSSPLPESVTRNLFEQATYLRQVVQKLGAAARPRALVVLRPLTDDSKEKKSKPSTLMLSSDDEETIFSPDGEGQDDSFDAYYDNGDDAAVAEEDEECVSYEHAYGHNGRQEKANGAHNHDHDHGHHYHKTTAASSSCSHDSHSHNHNHHFYHGDDDEVTGHSRTDYTNGSSMTNRAHLIEQEVQKRVVEEKLQGELRSLEDELLRTKRAAAERKATIESMLAATEMAKQDRQEREFENQKSKMSLEERVAAEVARQVKLLGLDNDDDDDAPVLSSSMNLGERGDRGSGGSPGLSLSRPRSEAGSNAPSVITEASPNGTPIIKAKKTLAAATVAAKVITVTAFDAGPLGLRLDVIPVSYITYSDSFAREGARPNVVTKYAIRITKSSRFTEITPGDLLISINDEETLLASMTLQPQMHIDAVAQQLGSTRRPVTLHVFHCPRLLPLAVAGSTLGSEGNENQGRGIVLPLSDDEARLFLRDSVPSSNPTHPLMKNGKDSSTPTAASTSATASVIPPPRAPTSPRPTGIANYNGVRSGGLGSSSSSSMQNNQHTQQQHEGTLYEIEFPNDGPLGIFLDSYTVEYHRHTETDPDANPLHRRYSNNTSSAFYHCCIVRQSKVSQIRRGDLLVLVNGVSLIGEMYDDGPQGGQLHDDRVSQLIKDAAMPRIIRFFRSPLIDAEQPKVRLGKADMDMLFMNS